ncbi:hypothetical protein MpV1_219c [Micromonas sp. RCC1109 virus MpV1]|uniref:hypothetical protein n=1 Tax=Micromonas sp. RCC1109 virus MpV1 TaxID=880161 RepID=UPI0001EF4522|nr:hypothetical protein MpV1_219c [Micromonas sp. RCC1109 virus MpV1]ADQ91142.1 hypothetical protein MpV1_219c [Micromonas sp. RCC1109 virus MpV1]
MSAALIELVSVGAQDVYITGSPQVSFFRQNYKRYTNFAMKPERMDYIGTFGASNEVTIPIRSKGDLMSYIWIEADGIAEVQQNSDGLYSNNAANPTEFQLWIGGQKVSELDSLYIQGVHNPLMRDSSAKASFAVTTNARKENHTGNHYMIPFFFGEDWTKALPLVALQYHDVEIRVKCRDGFNPTGTHKVFGNYIYLDTDERKYFTDTEHELLITQIQHQLTSNTDTDIDLSYFNHPVKSLHLVSGAASGVNWADEYNFSTASLYINGTALFENTSNVYHHDVVPEMHCTDLPDNILDDLPTYSWPFCLTMSKMQPTGSLNFSRIDNAKLVLNNPTGGNQLHRVYGVNYNILRIKNGMAGVAFGN